MDPPDPVEAIKFRMEQQGLTRRDLKEIIGTGTRIAEVLNRKRGLSIAMIRRLHEHLGISADLLIRPSRKSAAIKPWAPDHARKRRHSASIAYSELARHGR
jgi:HTH-type transcriptional regulator/antitoxin HigA